MSPASFRVSAIGLASWDRFLVTDHYPSPGTYAVVRETLEQAGGTTTNMAAALARMGIQVTIAAVVGDDVPGQRLRDQLSVDGCDVRFVATRSGEATDASTIVVSGTGASADRTIFWHQGARLRHGDRLPIAEAFAHDLVILDIDDERLHRLIVDLPIHVAPRTRLLGTLTYLTDLPPSEALDLALQHDALSGAAWQYRHITGAQSDAQAVEILKDRISSPHTVTRVAAVTLGARGCILIDESRAVQVPAFPVQVVDPTGAGDAFAAGFVIGLLQRLPLIEIGRLANAMGALTVRALGARTSLPAIRDVEDLLGSAALEAVEL